MIGHIQGKVWGTTQCIFGHNNVEMHRIATNKGGYCSVHCHRTKFNLFFVECGKLKVTIFRGAETEPRPTDSTELIAGMSSVVKPGERHQFEALEDTVAYEIYWTQLDSEDIIRDTEGGIRRP